MESGPPSRSNDAATSAPAGGSFLARWGGSDRRGGRTDPQNADLTVTVASDRPGGGVRTLRVRRRTLLGARLLATLLLVLAALWSGALAARLTRVGALEERVAELQATLERRELELTEARARLDGTALTARRLLHELGGVGAKVREVQSFAGAEGAAPAAGSGGPDAEVAPEYGAGAGSGGERGSEPGSAPGGESAGDGGALLPGSSVDLVGAMSAARRSEALDALLFDARADLGELDATLDAVRDTVEYRRALADATPGVWPVRGWVSSYFGLRRSPISGRTLMHKGLDLVAPYRTPVSSSAPGVVATAGWSTEGYGYHVIVDHGFGFTTLYAHLSEIRVDEGAWVGRGDVVGLLGNTGLSTGPHLHFEVWRHGAPVDPFEILAPLPTS